MTPDLTQSFAGNILAVHRQPVKHVKVLFQGRPLVGLLRD